MKLESEGLTMLEVMMKVENVISYIDNTKGPFIKDSVRESLEKITDDIKQELKKELKKLSDRSLEDFKKLSENMEKASGKNSKLVFGSGEK